MAIEFNSFDDTRKLEGLVSFIDTPEMMHIHLSEFAPGEELTVTLDRDGALRLRDWLNGIDLLRESGT